MSNEFKKQCGAGYYWCNTDKVCKPLQESDARIPKKPGQPDKSDKHSDLYTDEDPKGTIHGLKFATPDDAKASVSKIKSSGRSHAHKIQAAIAMEQRAKVMGKAGAAAVYRSFINSMKEDASVNAVGDRSDQSHKWALVQKSGPAEHRVEVTHHHTNEKPPHSSGQGAVWYKKIGNEWLEHGEHGRTDYRNILNKHLKEDGMAGGAPTNAVGGGQIAGIGIPPQGEPGVKKKKIASFISYMSRKMPK